MEQGGVLLWPHASHLLWLLTNVLRLWGEKLSIKESNSSLPPQWKDCVLPSSS